MKHDAYFIPVGLAIALASAGCCGSDSFDLRSELEIDRPDPAFVVEVVEHEDGTVTKKFPVGRSTYESLAFRSARTNSPPDPFAAPPAEADVEWPARKILENFDVPFPEGSEFDANYDLNAGILTVRHEPEWVDLVQVFLESLEPEYQIINLRIEIFEVPKALALRLEQSAGEHADHRPEREALEKVLRDGDAAFVTSCNLRTQSGQRASYRDGVDHLLFSEFEWDKTVEPPAPRPRIETRTVGTIIEFDPVLGADDKTVDFNLSLEHHTAPPAMERLKVPVPGQAEPMLIDAPVFHAKKLTTVITMLDKATKLLCSWQPTGLPEFEGRELKRIAFLRVDVQRTSEGFSFSPKTAD